jgi:hypothetical protein
MKFSHFFIDRPIFALRHAVFAMSAAVSIVRWRSSAFLNPRQFDRHGVRLLFGQNTYNSKRDCK